MPTDYQRCIVVDGWVYVSVGELRADDNPALVAALKKVAALTDRVTQLEDALGDAGGPRPVPEARPGSCPAHEVAIADIQFSHRVSDRLAAAGISTLDHLIRMDVSDLRRLKGLGRQSLQEIRDALAKRGLSLGMTNGDGR